MDLNFQKKIIFILFFLQTNFKNICLSLSEKFTKFATLKKAFATPFAFF